MPIQEIVDALAEHLQRSVVINDAEVRLRYASRHYGDEDEVRIRAVLQRVADGKAIGHVLAQGVTHWTAPGILPAKPAIGFRARVCVPIRWRGELLGLLIVLDPDGTLPAADLAEMEATARRLAPVMVTAQGGGGREALVTALLDPDAAVRRDAVRALRGDGVTGTAVQAMVVEVRDTGEPADPAHVEIALRHALATGTLARVRDRRATMIFCTGSPIPGPRLDQSAARVLDHVREISDGRFAGVAGIGAAATGLDAAWQSHRQAELACRAAGGLRPEPVVRWSELGALGVLLRLPADEIGPDSLPDEMRRLLAVDRDGHLVATLRAYLDAGGSGPAASEALHIHRTMLYYRLGRITELTGLDLADPATRLSLHLATRLLELIEHRLRPG